MSTVFGGAKDYFTLFLHMLTVEPLVCLPDMVSDLSRPPPPSLVCRLCGVTDDGTALVHRQLIAVSPIVRTVN